MESMKRGHLATGIACILILVLVVHGAAAGVVDRSVNPVGNSTYQVILRMPAESVIGINETISGGMSYGEISLSPDSYTIEGTMLSLAVIGEREVSYFVTLKPGDSGEISGTYKDMLSEDEGNLPGARILPSGSVEIIKVTDHITLQGKDSQARPTPMNPCLLMVALCVGGLLCSLRRGA